MNMQKLKLSLVFKIVTVLALTVQGNILLAQKPAPSKEFNYSVSKPYPVVDAAQKDYFHKGESIIAVKQSGKRVTIQRFAKSTLNQTSVREYSDMPAGYSYEGFVSTKEKLFLFFSVWDKSNKKEQLFCREIDYEKGVFVGKDKLLLTVDGKITGSPAPVPVAAAAFGFGFSTGVVDKFDFHLCLDSSKFMVQYRNKPETRDDAKSFDRVGLYVFDTEINKLWGKEVQMPYTEKKMDIEDYALDSRGEAYIVAKVYNNNSTKQRVKGGKVNYHMEIFSITDGSHDIAITKVNLGEKIFVSSILLYESTSDHMICVGYYNDGQDFDSVNGLFTFKVKKGGEIFESNTYDIPLEVINQYVSDRQKAKNEKRDNDGDEESVGLKFLKMRQLTVDGEGNFTILGEQNYSVTHSNGKYTYTNYYYNDMLITKIDASGKVAWMQKLPKRQVGAAGRGGMSFKAMSDNGYKYILYLDHEDNLLLPINKTPVFHKDGAGGFLTSYKVDYATGQVSKVSIFNTRDVKGTEVFQFQTGRIFSIDDNEFIVELYKKNKEDVMIRVELGKN